MTTSRRKALMLSAALGLGLAACGDASPGPQSDKEQRMASATAADAPMTEQDPYLWLEEVEGERALDWVKQQNARSLDELESAPRFEERLSEAKAILTSEERIPAASLRGGYAYNFWQDEKHVRGLWRRMPVADYVAGAEEWETILDIDALAEEEGENWVFKGADCIAPAYDRCMLTLSRGGSDAAVEREFSVEAKTFVKDGFALPEAKASLAWVSEDEILVGTSAEAATESGYPVKTRLWQRGTALDDAPVLFEGEKSDVAVWPFSLYDRAAGEHVTGILRAVTFYESEYHLKGESGAYEKMPFPAKVDLVGYLDGRIILGLNEDWSYGGETYPIGAVVAFDPETKAAELVFAPSSTQAVQSVSSGKDAIFVSLLDDISGRILRLSPTETGWREDPVALPEGGVVSVSSIDQETGDMLLLHEDPVTPETLYYSDGEAEPRPIKTSPSFFDAAGVAVRQYKAVSSDGTEIPYTVIAKESVLEGGPAPTIQYGYGGFQVSILPQYSGTQGKLWVEDGGVYVIANIRGGGEYGPTWHQAGLKGKRQLIYDDFFAVSEDLIERGITTKDRLGILGGSNGGLLMGVSMVQRPDLYEAVGIGVPLLDMLRYHKLLAGASWVGEYGSPDIAEERAFLETISPYQNLQEEADYPRPFFFTSTKDDRVHPGHARKMAAKMEGYGQPFLYYENIEGGHGAAANLDQTARRLALQYTYFAQELGLGEE